MASKIKIGVVNYLNTKPLIYGFEQGMMKDEIELIYDYPAKVAASLLNDEIDIGLVPVAILPEMTHYNIIGDYCIGSEGAVGSVCIFSEVPLQEIDTILMDYQSRTSVKLAKVLINDFWKLNPLIKNAGNDFLKEIKGNTAALVIGDRALEQRKISTYCYDLGLAWKEYTNLPFVYAAWVSKKAFDKKFIEDFDKSNNFGLQNISKVVALNPYDIFNLNDYYTKYISFNLTDEKRLGLKTFLNKL